MKMKLFYLVIMIGFVGIISSCSNDDNTHPSEISFPSIGIPPEIIVGEGFTSYETLEVKIVK